jgi:hypothetical protein
LVPLVDQKEPSLKFPPTAQIALLAALALLGWTPAADAYIDPTAAGAALQSAYVIMISALMAITLVPKKVGAAFAWIKGRVMPGKAPAPTTDTHQD